VLPQSQPGSSKGSLSRSERRLGLPLVAILGLERGILEESERIEIDSDGVEKGLTMRERVSPTPHFLTRQGIICVTSAKFPPFHSDSDGGKTWVFENFLT
jgi:hypothetical protein